MTACKTCIIIRMRVIARGMLALGFSVEAAKEKVEPQLTAVGLTLRIQTGAWFGKELIADNTKVEDGEFEHYSICREGGLL